MHVIAAPAGLHLFAPQLIIILQSQNDTTQLLQVRKAKEQQGPLGWWAHPGHTHTHRLIQDISICASEMWGSLGYLIKSDSTSVYVT